MSMLTLPDEDRALLFELLDLIKDQPESAADLTAKVQAAGPDSGVRALLTHQLPISGMQPEAQFRTIRGLMALSAAHKVSQQSLEEFLGQLIASPSLGIGSQQQSQLREILGRLLNAPALVESSNALSLLDDNPNRYYSARIITEVRYLVPDSLSDMADPSAKLNFAVITHLLKITCQGDEGERQIFVGMDNEDLRHLKDVVRRAELKYNIVKTKLAEHEIQVLGEAVH